MATIYINYPCPQDFVFSPEDYLGSGLSGTEGSIVVLAGALVKRGHKVTVFANPPTEDSYEGARWLNASALKSCPSADLLICARNDTSVRDASRHRRSVFWMLSEVTSGPKAYAERISGPGATIVTASQAMDELLVSAGVISAPTFRIPLPVPLGRVPERQRSCAALYCSVPDRGLATAISLWPRVRKLVPDAELWVTSGFELWKFPKDTAARMNKESIAGTRVSEGVKFLGILPKLKLREVMEEARIMFYPSNFDELFCVSAVECSAAGLPIVATRRAALSERVVDGVSGYLIDGPTSEQTCQDQFVVAAKTLLTDSSLCEKMGSTARTMLDDCAPAAVAAKWEALLPS